MKPTKEQQQIIDANERIIKVTAFAGTGKTSTLIERAKAHSDRTIYLAFNKSVQVEAEKRFPRTVTCKTQHGLAYAAVMTRGFQGVRYTLGRLSIFKTAKTLRVYYYMASLVHKTVENFCQSADETISKAHSEPDRISRYSHDISELLAQRAKEVWDWMVEGRNPDYPMTHSGYLKLFQLSKPRLGYSVVMLDEAQDTNPVVHDIVLSQAHYGSQVVLVGDPYQQIYCQPAGTLVTVVSKPGNGKTGKSSYQKVPIEQIKAGMSVLSYSLQSGYAAKSGHKVKQVGQRQYSGYLVSVTADGKTSRYTHNHHCIVRIGDVFSGRHIVYLMRRGKNYRIGRTTWRNYSQHNQIGCLFRAKQEKADAFWILDTYATKEEAALAELDLSWNHGVPTTTFVATKNHIIGQKGLNEFWNTVGDNTPAATALLEDMSEYIDLPFWTKGSGNLLNRRPITTAATNIHAGMEVLVQDDAIKDGKRISNKVWKKIDLVREDAFDGTVYSLEVENSHTYFADEILTHNCWRGAVDAMKKVKADPYYITQSFRFGPQVADTANHILNEFFGETRPLVGLGAAGDIEGLAGDEIVDVTGNYTFLARTNAFLFAEASRLAGTTKMYVPGSGQFGELPIFQSVLDVFALYQGRKGDIRDFELKNFENYWDLLDFVSTGQADPEWNVATAVVERYKSNVPDQINRIRGSLVQRPEDAPVTLITAHRAKGLEWDNVVMGSDYAEMFNEQGHVRPLGDNRKTEIAPDEVNLAYVAATRAKKRLTLNRQLTQLITHRGGHVAPVAPAMSGVVVESGEESEALVIDSSDESEALEAESHQE